MAEITDVEEDVKHFLSDFDFDEKEIREYKDRRRYGDKAVDVMLIPSIPMLIIIPALLLNRWLALFSQDIGRTLFIMVCHRW